MATRRTKSASEINAQVRRIQELSAQNSRRFNGGYGSPRYNNIDTTASNIGMRYQMNMIKAASKKGIEIDGNTKFSRRTYMGLSNG